MRKGIAIFFSLIILCSSCTDLIQLALFKLNQDYIASVFCINKNKPQLKCDGKCYLKKSIAKSATEKEGKQVAPPDDKSPVILDGLPQVPTDLFSTSSNDSAFAYQAYTSSWLPADIPHPPQV